MECSQCGRNIPDNRETCLYCGGPGKAQGSKSLWTNKGGGVLVSEERDLKTDHVPGHLRQKVEEDIRKGKGKVIAKKERTITQSSSTVAKEARAVMPLEKTLSLLSKLKGSFDGGDIDYDVYEGMVAGIISDYVSDLPDDVRIGFVMQDITDSDLSEYITDDILRDLRAQVLAGLDNE